jgi:hypothetical protein
MRIYGKYLRAAFNECKQCAILCEKAMILEKKLNQRKDIKIGLTDEYNLDGQEDGAFFISLDEEKLGEIFAMNITGTTLFGYLKEELIGKNINKLMPD